MFTGIVQDLGKIESISSKGEHIVVLIQTQLPTEDLSKGNSISVNGVCLTVEESRSNSFTVTAVKETLDVTNLSSLKPNSRVNLEAALRLNTPLAGHFVSGHVDGLAKVIEAGERFKIQVPSEFIRFMPKKGSITLNGVSLTIANVNDDMISIALIPETLSVTNLGLLEAGDLINFEVDLLARYLDQLQK